MPAWTGSVDNLSAHRAALTDLDPNQQDDDRSDEGADDAGGLKETVLPILVEQQVTQEPADEGSDEPKTMVITMDMSCRPGTTRLARAPAIKPMMSRLTMRPSMMCLLLGDPNRWVHGDPMVGQFLVLVPLKHPTTDESLNRASRIVHLTAPTETTTGGPYGSTCIGDGSSR